MFDETIALITNKRVHKITMCQLYEILPKSTHGELVLFQHLLKDEEMEIDKKHESMGAILELMIYRIKQEEVKM